MLPHTWRVESFLGSLVPASHFRSWISPEILVCVGFRPRILRGQHCPEIWCPPANSSHLKRQRCPEIRPLTKNTSRFKRLFSPRFADCIGFHLAFYELNIARDFRSYRAIPRTRRGKHYSEFRVLLEETFRLKSWILPGFSRFRNPS